MFEEIDQSLSGTCKLGVGGSKFGSDRVCGIVCKDEEGLQTVFGVGGYGGFGSAKKSKG